MNEAYDEYPAPYQTENHIESRNSVKVIELCLNGSNYTYYIGRSAAENTYLVNNSNPCDLWFHLAQHPSCHVVCALEGRNITNKKMLRKIVRQGAVLCKANSKLRGEKRVAIDYAYIRNVATTQIPGKVFVSTIKKEVII